jgi:hypothetical protein
VILNQGYSLCSGILLLSSGATQQMFIWISKKHSWLKYGRSFCVLYNEMTKDL